jgi:hypothetical protein
MGCPGASRQQHDLAGQGAGLTDGAVLLEFVSGGRFGEFHHAADLRPQLAPGQPAIDFGGAFALFDIGGFHSRLLPAGMAH